MIVVFLALLCLTQTGSLTGTIVSQACHCDLTPSLCDIDCCCDSSCSNVYVYISRLKPIATISKVIHSAQIQHSSLVLLQPHQIVMAVFIIIQLVLSSKK